MLLTSCSWHWTRFSIRQSVVLATVRKHSCIDYGFSYKAPWVEEWVCSYCRFRVKVHPAQLLLMLPHPHKTEFQRLGGFMATIATAHLSVAQIVYPVHWCGWTNALPRGVCLLTTPKYSSSITRPLLIDYPNTILYIDVSFTGYWLTGYDIALNTFQCWLSLILLSYQTAFCTCHKHVLSTYRSVVECCIPMAFITTAIAAIEVITAINAIVTPQVVKWDVVERKYCLYSWIIALSQ